MFSDHNLIKLKVGKNKNKLGNPKCLDGNTFIITHGHLRNHSGIYKIFELNNNESAAQYTLGIQLKQFLEGNFYSFK